MATSKSGKKAAPKAAKKSTAATPKPKETASAAAPAEVKQPAPAAPAPSAEIPELAEMKRVLEYQKRAYIEQGAPNAALRRDWIERAIITLKDNADRIVEALNADFGSRSDFQSTFTDVLSSIDRLKFAKKHLHRWMKPSRRSPAMPFGLLGASARVEFRPLGTVGCISPWNFPVYLTFAPLAGIFAAGNRVMLKPSELTPATAELMQEMFNAAYDEDEVAIFTGGPEIGQAFSSLPFDHLLYTGGCGVAKHIARAAAENLVPVTLELGGKSPVILGQSADPVKAADKVMFGKTLNAGQICLAPDYLMMPQEKVQDFVAASRDAVNRYYAPGLKHNPDYSSLINQRHYERVKELIEDARAKGAELVELNPTDEDFAQQPHHKIPPTLVLNPTDNMRVMQEEIFGPVLPIVGYQRLDEAIERVNNGDRPLGLYYFGKDRAEERQVLQHTLSGGVTVNDVMFHISHDNLPFGGVGNSGQGRYQGYDGFLNFSHHQAVYRQTPINISGLFVPPHTAKQRNMLRKQIGI